MPIKIATRKSPLALRQTELVELWLQEHLPISQSIQQVRLETEVDKRLAWSLEKRGGIGLFTKELEAALLANEVDLAVHSAKDLPTQFSQQLEIAGYLPRAVANDVLIHTGMDHLPAQIGTSSPRRRAQIERLFPNCNCQTIRGNVQTRLEKLAQPDNQLSATLLAAAGLERLGIAHYKNLQFKKLSFEQMVPAPGQGAIAIQCRTESLDKFAHLFCETTRLAVNLERAFLHRLGGGCQTPVGAHYAADCFYIFHPKTGLIVHQQKLNCIDEIEDYLSPLFEKFTFSESLN
jgi:hydroxymethylbilane synthase